MLRRQAGDHPIEQALGKSLSHGRKSRRARLFFVGCIAAIGWGAVSSAGADPLVCATLYYRVFGGPKQYVLNNECYVSTPWPTVIGSGLRCTSVDSIVEVCREVKIAMP